jgi:hypothetical protein
MAPESNLCRVVRVGEPADGPPIRTRQFQGIPERYMDQLAHR